jgi:hypothetical protein
MLRTATALVMAGIWAALCVACQASAGDWKIEFLVGDVGGGSVVGVKPGATDGYDGETPGDPSVSPGGVLMALYRQAGSGWPPGFYSVDYVSPIASGTSKTWNDIYLWSQNWTPRLGDRVWIGLYSTKPAPHGYWGQIVLDYVPPSLNWTGPTEFWFSLDPNVTGDIAALPVPIASNPTDPMQVTRMHLTVYAPEPSSLAALLAGLVGLGAVMRRRRR